MRSLKSTLEAYFLIAFRLYSLLIKRVNKCQILILEVLGVTTSIAWWVSVFKNYWGFWKELVGLKEQEISLGILMRRTLIQAIRYFQNSWKKDKLDFWKHLLLFSHSVMSDALQSHGLQHTRLPCPSPSLAACLNSSLLRLWCHPPISPSVVLLLWASIFPSIRVFSNELALHIR